MRRRRQHRAIAVVWAASLAVGCTSAATLTASDQPAETAPPPSSSTIAPASSSPTLAPLIPSPVPTLPALATEATTERDGVEIHLELERNPLPAGERTWATVKIQNRAEATVPWMTDGCDEAAMVMGTLGGDWVTGTHQTGIAERFKAYALEPLGHAGQAYLGIGFDSERYLGRDVGCADLGIRHELRPGEKLVYRAAWDGALGDLAPADGPVTIVASFPVYIDDGSFTHDPIEVRLESWIVGGTPFEFLTPAAAIDVALGDARFFEWLERAPESTWINSTHTLDPGAGTWEIGLFRESPAGFFGTVTFDVRTGEVLDHRFE